MKKTVGIDRKKVETENQMESLNDIDVDLRW